VKLAGAGALVAGGASGLGAATARELVERGARVAVVDRDGERAAELTARLGRAEDEDAAVHPASPAPRAVALEADVTEESQLGEAVGKAVEAFGELRLAVSCAGIGWADRTVGREGPAALAPFETVVGVNLIGSFNVLRLTAAAMAGNEPGDDGERGAVVMTASIAAFDGQIGQAAYAASKGGIVSLTLPAARDLARQGIRVCTIAPGTFDTPLLAALPDDARRALGDQVPFPQRLGKPDDFAHLACHIAENPMLNGETIRLDGALRMPPR
jgi:3-hydroxyacyl-CoA dehydrogenase / 3-hydroxy-2-methylbutyryl-CoA dehydrogenase